MTRLTTAALLVACALPSTAAAQTGTVSAVPPARDLRVGAIAEAPRADRIERDIRALVGFGTRNTLSDTLSETRGIGAARRWIKAEFDRISADCGGCLTVGYQRMLVPGDAQSRIPDDTWVVNVVAIQRGRTMPDRYVIMSGDIDSRVTDVLDAVSESPGANDNASGMAGTLEAARVLTQYEFDKSIVYAGLSGEEQGLFGGRHMAGVAAEEGWNIEAVLNNDMIGNTHGLNGVIDNTTYRVFSEPTPVTETEQQRMRRRFTGGEVDGPSRQLARYVARISDMYLPQLDAMMVYRLDRFGRGGHHRPFNDRGFPAVRIMETNENYQRQHQDLRTEDGVDYGDVIEWVDFDYAATLTGVNAAVLAALAWAPAPPQNVRVSGAVQPSTTLRWDAPAGPGAAGYKVYWRLTTEPQWTDWVWVGSVTEHTLMNVVIDNYLFGVAAVGADGHESVVVFPGG